MRFILTGKCICGKQFNKNEELKDITLNESNLVQFRCEHCMAFFNVSTLWVKEVVPKTIAQSLHGKNGDSEPPKGRVYFDPDTAIHTFEDGSQARLITRFVDSDPYVTKSLSTSSKKEIRVWSALV